jgi:hypothetical protein
MRFSCRQLGVNQKSTFIVCRNIIPPLMNDSRIPHIVTRTHCTFKLLINRRLFKQLFKLATDFAGSIARLQLDMVWNKLWIYIMIISDHHIPGAAKCQVSFTWDIFYFLGRIYYFVETKFCVSKVWVILCFGRGWGGKGGEEWGLWFHFIRWSDFGASYTWGVKLGVSSNICVQ